MNNSDFKVLGVCDCYELHLNQARDNVNNFYQNKECLVTTKYEEAIQRDDIDAVLVTTPDHCRHDDD